MGLVEYLRNLDGIGRVDIADIGKPIGAQRLAEIERNYLKLGILRALSPAPRLGVA
jgi:hypothetical protein